MSFVNLLVYQGDKSYLLDWCRGRHCAPADIINDLIDEHIDSLEERYPKEVYDAEDNTKADLDYESRLDYKMEEQGCY